MKSTGYPPARTVPADTRWIKSKPEGSTFLMDALRLFKNYLLLRCYDQPMFEAMVCSIAAAFGDITR